MRWMRNDDVLYDIVGKQDWPDSLEVVGIDEANRGVVGRMDCPPFGDRDDRPMLMGDVYKGGTWPRQVLDAKPAIVLRPVREDAQVWEVQWEEIPEGSKALRVPVKAQAGGALGTVEVAPDVDAEGYFIPVGWVECAFINARCLDAWPIVVVSRPDAREVRRQAPWSLLREA